MKNKSESEKLMDNLEPIKDWEDEGGYIRSMEYNDNIDKEKQRDGKVN